jgi:hypothetical protein
MTAIFAQTTPDENLKPGWNVQGTGVGQSTSGIPGEGYAEPGVIPPGSTLSAQLQPTAGVPFPPGALNNSFIGGENSGSYFQSILTDPGYADGSTILGQSVAWTTANGLIPATTVAKVQPFGTNALMTVTGGTVTAIDVTPFGAASGTTLVLEGGQTLSVSIPPAASVALTYATGDAPTSVTFVSTGA